MTIQVIAALAVLSVALLAAVTAAVNIARAGSRLEDRLRRSLRELCAEIDALSTMVGTAVERLRREIRVSETLAVHGTAVNLTDVLTGVATAALELCRADAALVHAFDADGKAIHAAAGAPGAGSMGAICWPPGDTGAMSLAFTYADDNDPHNTANLPVGIAVPLGHPGAARGSIAAYWRDPQTRTEHAASDLETLARRTVLLLDQEWRPTGPQIVDPLTALGARQAFHETLSREVARARGDGSKLALIMLDVDGLQAVNREVGHLASDVLLADVAARICESSGPGAVACRVGGDEFTLILPRTSLAVAEQVYARVREAMPRHPSAGRGRLGLSAGIAELRADDNAIALVARANEALGRAKHSHARSPRLLAEPGLP